MNPFYFNDTSAYLLDDSFTKQEVEAAWYLWRDDAVQVDIPEWVEVVKVSQLGEYEGRTIRHPDVGQDLTTAASTETPALQASPLEGEQSNGFPLLKGEEKGVFGQSNKEWKNKAKRTINPSILKKVIQDEQWNVYRVMKMEYEFLVKYWLPLPKTHRLDRIKQHFTVWK
jgi:hypothetical protein